MRHTKRGQELWNFAKQLVLES